MSAPTLLLVARHGETAWNAEGRIQGQIDVPLSATGHGQAIALARAIADRRFDAIYASDLERVRQTAAPALRQFGLPVTLDPALRERHYGSFQEITYTEAKARFPEAYARFAARDPEFDFLGGESLSGFAARVTRCVEGIVARHPGASLLVYTHGGVLDVLYRRATGRSLQEKRDFDLPNAAINLIECRGADWRVRAWAERAHLESTLDEPPL